MQIHELITSIFSSIVVYNTERDNYTYKQKSALKAKLEARELATRICEAISELTDRRNIYNESIFGTKVATYSSNPDTAIYVSNQIFNNLPRLKEISPEDIAKQVFTILDGLFKLPLRTAQEIAKGEFATITPSQVDPTLTQLVRIIVAENLIDDFLDLNDQEQHKEMEDMIAKQQLEAISQLGEVGLMILQSKLDFATQMVYEKKNKQVRYELNELLKLINAYDLSEIDDKAFDKKLLRILLLILENELELKTDPLISQKQKKYSSSILKLSAEILSRCNLVINSNTDFLTRFVDMLKDLKGKTKLKVLEAFSGATFINSTADTQYIAEEMVRVLASLKKDSQGNYIVQDEHKRFARQFLIDNPNAELVHKIIEILDIPIPIKEPEGNISLRYISAILIEWAKEGDLKETIQELLMRKSFCNPIYKILILDYIRQIK